jgi:hypothetical protein
MRSKLPARVALLAVLWTAMTVADASAQNLYCPLNKTETGTPHRLNASLTGSTNPLNAPNVPTQFALRFGF